MEIEIIELTKRADLIENAADYFWSCWGNENNYNFYKDCISNSLNENNPLPKFYLVLDKSVIVGAYAILTNDLISRQDLMPWLACLHVNEAYRKQGIAGKLLRHGLEEAKRKGYDQLYLSTDLDGFYEKHGWSHIADGYNVVDDKLKIYAKSTTWQWLQ